MCGNTLPTSADLLPASSCYVQCNGADDVTEACGGIAGSDSYSVSGTQGASSSVNGDPHFVGFQGEKYDVQGEPEKWFNILSDAEVQVNAFFSQMYYNGKGQTNMVSVGIMVNGRHILLNNASQIFVDDNEVTQKQQKGEGSANIVASEKDGKRNGTVVAVLSWSVANRLVKMDTFDYVIALQRTESHKGAAFFDVGISLKHSRARPHGLVGQTAHHVYKGGNTNSNTNTAFRGHEGEGVIEGTFKDYEVSSAFATDFLYNRYGKKV